MPRLNLTQCLCLIIPLMLGARFAFADDVAVEKSPLFTAGEQGYATFRIPGLVITSRGTLLAYCEARRSAKGDWVPIDIMMRRSVDGGKSWSPAKVIAQPPADAKLEPGAAGITLNNPLAIADSNSRAIHFLYCVNYARCFIMHSDDDGATFSSPVEITATFEKFRPEYNWNVLATGPGHGITLRSGRLLVPIWLSTGGHTHRPSAVATVYSDDSGKTWQRGQIIVTHTPTTPNPSESAVAEMADGRVMISIRNESFRYRRLVAFSADGATNWSEPKFDDALVEPICEGSLTTVPHDAETILFANPANPEAQQGSNVLGAAKGKQRINLTVKLSRDMGTTWRASKVIDSGIAGYCDLAADPGGTVYCLYERGGAQGNQFDTQSLTLARFDVSWISR
ncbi:MAG TPA: sialidase family protein [Humisphaera sp.]|jgi:sialidase-1|nr:sialidase family protein [Humisphaera sp.]